MKPEGSLLGYSMSDQYILGVIFMTISDSNNILQACWVSLGSEMHEILCLLKISLVMIH
jgi:hypothetical protein